MISPWYCTFFDGPPLLWADIMIFDMYDSTYNTEELLLQYDSVSSFKPEPGFSQTFFFSLLYFCHLI